MKGLIIKSVAICCTIPLWGLKNDPWIPPPFEFHSDVRYSYSYFPSVANAINPTNYSSFVNDLAFEINGSATPELFFELELEFDNSSKVSFDLLSVAPVVKYQIMNDLIGDPIAIIVGTYFRYVPENRLVDVATEYSGSYNFDFLVSIGKELEYSETILASTFAMFDVGIATVGMPWILADIVGKVLLYKHHELNMGVDGFFGFGLQDEVNIDNFNGYGNINHNSMDIKMGYGYKFSVWGELSFLYKRRVVAISAPSDTNFFGLQYDLSFSF